MRRHLADHQFIHKIDAAFAAIFNEIIATTSVANEMMNEMTMAEVPRHS